MTFGVLKPTKLPSHPHLHCGQSRNRASRSLKAKFPEGPGRVPSGGQETCFSSKPTTLHFAVRPRGCYFPLSVPQSLSSACAVYS